MTAPKGKTWSKEEEEILQEYYGVISIEGLQKKIDRSRSAIQNKVSRMRLGRWYHQLEAMTLNELAQGINVNYSTLKRWYEKYDLPVKKQRFKKDYFHLVKIDEFWKWAETHKNMIEWDKVERHSLGAEPDWVRIARAAAHKNKDNSQKKIPWSKDDDEKLLWMLKQYKFTYTDIADELNRTHGAVKKRIRDLGIKLRPIYRDNHKKYTQKEIELIISMYQSGYSFKIIAKELDRSSDGIRGKLERMGFVFNNRVLSKRGERDGESAV